MKNSDFRKGVITGLVSALLFMVIVVGSTGFILERKGMPNLWTVGNKLLQMERIVNQSFYYETKSQKMADGIYKGFAYGLDDPYANYYNEAETEQELRLLGGNYCGIGAMVKHLADGTFIIDQVFADSPAERGGLQTGDIIEAVDGLQLQDIPDLTLENLVSGHILGEVDTAVSLTVFRASLQKTLVLDFVRQELTVQTVHGQMLNDETGYLQITEFDNQTNAQFKTAIRDLQQQGMKQMIYDLRDCPGGSLDAVVDILDYVLPQGLLVYTEDRRGNRIETFEGTDDHEVDLPAVILVNGGTASAAELFASALRDYGRGQLVGTQTYGKGIVQSLVDLQDGTMLKLTIAAYFTKNGVVIQGEGLTPDLVIEGTGKDSTRNIAIEELLAEPQVQAGLELLKDARN